MAPKIVRYGAGTNSTALLVGMWERGERPDAIVFADTGGERPATYAYLTMFSAWLVERGFPAIITTRRAKDNEETLEANCLRFSKLPSVAYGYKMCSTEFKRDPGSRWVRENYPGQDYVCVLGYDADEPERANRARPVNRHETIECPLIGWGWGRPECETAILRAGLPLPGKSACFFCPNTSKERVRDLRRTLPDLFDRAVAIEKNAAAEDTRTGTRSAVVGLGRRVRWADIGEEDERQVKLWPDEMPCDCYDGGAA